MKNHFDLHTKIQLETVHMKVVRILRQAILKGEIAPGSRLVQEDIAKSLGVSRMPVREALKELEMEGLVINEPHRGAVVKSFNVEEIEEIYALRSYFEKIAVEKSVPMIGEKDMESLEALVTKMEESGEIGEFANFNIEFHKQIMKNCPWKRLLFFIENLWNGFPKQAPHILLDQRNKYNQEHRHILEAIKKGDAQIASELMYQHIKHSGEDLIEIMKDGAEN